MRISSVTGTNYAAFRNQTQKTSHTPNFKGILVSKSHEESDWDFWGQQSSSALQGGHYVGSSDSYGYTYHPFKDESEESISKAIKENNYSSYEEGYNHFITVYTDRGRTLPFTKKQWSELSAREKEVAKIML